MVHGPIEHSMNIRGDLNLSSSEQYAVWSEENME